MNIETTAQVIICALQQECQLGDFSDGEFYPMSDNGLEKIVVDVLKKILEKEEITL